MANPSEKDSIQLRPGLWETVNERYPGSMITKDNFVPLAHLKKPLSEALLSFVSTAGVQPRGTMPFDTVHPIGDYTFRRVPSDSKPTDLEIHQLKYPTGGAMRDLNVLSDRAIAGVGGGKYHRRVNGKLLFVYRLQYGSRNA